MWGCNVDADFIHCAAVSWSLPQFVLLLATMLAFTVAVVTYGIPAVGACMRWVDRWFPDRRRKPARRVVLPKP